MNDVIRTILSRHSTRRFANAPVPLDIITTILECARWAPSGSNQQPWYFDVINDNARIDGISDVIVRNYDLFLNTIDDEGTRASIAGYKQYLSFVKTAPVVIAVSAKPYESFLSKKLAKYGIDNPFAPEDIHPAALSVGAAVENMLIAAESLGYASCWMTGPMMFQKELESFLKISPPWHLVSLVLIGKPYAGEQATRSRLPLSEISSFNYET